MEKAVAKVPPMPVENLAGPGQPQMDPRIAARLSDIGGSAGGGSPVPVTPAAASSEHPPVRPVLPDMTGPSALSKDLTPTTLVASRATEIPNPRFTIEQGRVLQCTQQTKINTSFPGGVTAILPEGVRGETGDVTLLDPGSRVFGTIEHGMINGLDRAFVLWQNITTPVMYDPDGTPRQLRVTVNSPAADQLGQGGLMATSIATYLRKFGAAIAFSLLQGEPSRRAPAALASGGGGSGSLNSNYLNFQSGDQVASQALSATVNIPDVLTRDQGLPCSIFVSARSRRRRLQAEGALMSSLTLTSLLEPLQLYFGDPGVEEIIVNRPGEVWIWRAGVFECHEIVLDADDIIDIGIVAGAHRRQDIGPDKPLLATDLQGLGRLQVVLPNCVAESKPARRPPWQHLLPVAGRARRGRAVQCDPAASGGSDRGGRAVAAALPRCGLGDVPAARRCSPARRSWRAAGRRPARRPWPRA